MEVVKFLFQLQNNIKLYHWQTTSYSRHIASDNLHTRLLLLTDQFIESYSGKYGKISRGNFQLDISSYNDTNIEIILEKASKQLQNINQLCNITSKDTDLLNIRDEMLQEINKTLYLFQLK